MSFSLCVFPWNNHWPGLTWIRQWNRRCQPSCLRGITYFNNHLWATIYKSYGSPGVQLRDFTSQVKQNNPRHWCTEGGKEPWLVRFSGLSAGLRTKGSPVLYPVRAHAWVASQVPSKGYMRGNLTLMFLSLSFSLSYLLSKTEKNLLKIKKVRSTVSLHPSHPTQGTEHRHVWEPIRKHSLTRHQDLLTQSSQFIRVPRWLVCTFWEALHYHMHRCTQMIFPVVLCIIYDLSEWRHAARMCPSAIVLRSNHANMYLVHSL